jgi:sirohydrochlorin cobaltochelatase
VTYRYGTPLAPHAQLIELLSLRVGQTIADAPDAFPPEETAVLVVGRGSSDPTSNSEVARTAYLLYERRSYVAVMYAFRAVARPNISDGLRRCAALGAKQVIVVPYILFTGKVIEDIRSASRKTDDKLGIQVLHALYLGVHPLLLDVAAQRLQEAIDGTANMTCDICKYRYPMAGYEHQVGQPQETH